MSAKPYCHDCDTIREARTDGNTLYCAVCGANVGAVFESANSTVMSSR